ncbi:MAG: hypothetical protein GXP42_05425, partial [Chloroflexi bacterium]|nr:hypothetical protein [Chloroflexota bacterium]
MTFTVRDYHDLVSLLYRYPEWRAELRELILSEDFLELPRSVQELIEAQKRTEESLKELIEVQKRADHRMDRLEASVQEL